VTPDVHKVHHSCEVAETNSNYGNVLTVYDRLLGTFTSSERAASVTYGLKDVDSRQASKFGALLAMPFRTRSRQPYTKVSFDGESTR
jgi:sterol desaturase/sphingolipid hydroxylase (fatty acid hydroxylase superfamily)